MREELRGRSLPSYPLPGLGIAQSARIRRPARGWPPAGYRTSVGTTLMLLNGDPLISFVLTTV